MSSFACFRDQLQGMVFIKGTFVCDRLRSSPSSLRKLDRPDRCNVADNATLFCWLIEKRRNKLRVGINILAKRLRIVTNND
jgi:hypothetical protein